MSSVGPGTRLGPYEIVASIGAGGMGEVYRAKDTRLDRTVAIKILPPELAESAERKERFQREARAISQLNHPNICTLYDVGEDDGVDFIVMEYLEGETLAALLTRRRLPLDTALDYGVQIAEGLNAAHRERIVHRDLKPANIIITRTGVKVLDFGLAKLVEGGFGAEASDAPTKQKELTQERAILGTLQYMAPEQLESTPVDHRTDIFALGAVIYEMVSGRKAFEGESQASLIAAIMSASPRPLTELVTLVPASLDHVVRKCLAKPPDDRWQSARDVSTELGWNAETKAAVSESVEQPGKGSTVWKFAAMGCAAAAIALAWLAFGTAPSEPAPTVRFTVPVQPSRDVDFAVSPDGRHLVYTGAGKLWLRALDELARESIPETHSARYPFWSPDGRNIGFFEQGRLKRFRSRRSVGDRDLRVDSRFWRDMEQRRDHRFREWWRPFTEGASQWRGARPGDQAGSRAPGGSAHITSVSAGRATLSLSGRAEHSENQWDLRRLARIRRVEAPPAGSRRERSVAPPGFILFVRDGNWFAQGFDPAGLELEGEPVFLASDIDVSGNVTGAAVSESGVLAYQRETAQRRLVWFDRAGSELAVVAPVNTYTKLGLSPDDTQAVLGGGPTRTIGVLDLVRGGESTFPNAPYLQGPPGLVARRHSHSFYRQSGRA